MGALSRFFIPAESWDDAAPVLRGEEAHHCVRVARHRVGDEIEIFQGRGISAVARIVGFRGGEVELETLGLRHSEPLAVAVTLAQAVPAGKTMDWIVRKAVEIGVSRVVPLRTTRTAIPPQKREVKGDKWRRLALEACKQCGRNWLPEVSEILEVEEFLRQDGAHLRFAAALLPEAKRLRHWSTSQTGNVASVSVAIGPEGDFTAEELEAFRQGGTHFLSLGPTTLRADTAALYALSVISHEWLERRADPTGSR